MLSPKTKAAIKSETPIDTLKDINRAKAQVYTQIERTYELEVEPTWLDVKNLCGFVVTTLSKVYNENFRRLPRKLIPLPYHYNHLAGTRRIDWCAKALGFILEGKVPEFEPDIEKEFGGIEAPKFDENLTLRDVVTNLGYAVGIYADLYEEIAIDLIQAPKFGTQDDISDMKNALLLVACCFKVFLNTYC